MREMTVSLDPNSGTHLYEQLAQSVVAEVRSGRLKEGERLPGRRALARHLGVSLSTVANAYAALEAEGYIEGRARSGYYACAYDPPLSSAAPQASDIQEEDPAPDAAHPFSTAGIDTTAFPYATWARLQKQVIQSGQELLNRGHPQGDLSLRAALRSFLHQYRGVVCAPEQIVIGAGVEYLTLFLFSLLEKEICCALEDPGYGAVYSGMRAARCRVTPIGLDERGMRADELSRSAARVAYVTPSHQFPTGITMPAGRRAQLLSWASEKNGRYIIEDDYDSEFRHLTRPIPAMQGMDGRRVIYMGTFSRSIAPSIRAAYLVLPPALLGVYRERNADASVTVSRFEQQTLARFITEGHYQRHLRRMGSLYKRRRDRLVDLLSKIDDVRLSGHEAGLHFLLTHARLSETELIRRAGERGIRMRGLSEFAHTHSTRSGTLVIGYGGLADHTIESAVEALRCAWR